MSDCTCAIGHLQLFVSFISQPCSDGPSNKQCNPKRTNYFVLLLFGFLWLVLGFFFFFWEVVSSRSLQALDTSLSVLWVRKVISLMCDTVLYIIFSIRSKWNILFDTLELLANSKCAIIRAFSILCSNPHSRLLFIMMSSEEAIIRLSRVKWVCCYCIGSLR